MAMPDEKRRRSRAVQLCVSMSMEKKAEHATLAARCVQYLLIKQHVCSWCAYRLVTDRPEITIIEQIPTQRSKIQRDLDIGTFNFGGHFTITHQFLSILFFAIAV